MRAVLTDLVDLVFPADCPGCGAAGRASPMCPACERGLRSQRARPVRPTPAPVGLPPCAALGEYRGTLRRLLLSYKEHGRLALAGALGAGLAAAVLVVAPGARELILVPVPASRAAARVRGGDHVRRLARRAARELRSRGRRAMVRPALVATPRMADSTTLTAAERARRSRGAFRSRRSAMRWLAAEAAGRPGASGAAPPTRSRRAVVRRSPAVRAVSPCSDQPSVPGSVAVVVVDDILTTGSTAVAVSGLLSAGGVPVAGVATLAATRRRLRPPSDPTDPPPAADGRQRDVRAPTAVPRRGTAPDRVSADGGGIRKSRSDGEIRGPLPHDNGVSRG